LQLGGVEELVERRVGDVNGSDFPIAPRGEGAYNSNQTMRKLIYIAGTVAILAAAFVVVQRARPNPLPAQSQPSQAP